MTDTRESRTHTAGSHLLARLDAIGASLEATGRARALIGLGSVGVELERLDDCSDLDFFAIVEEGEKPAFLDDLSWLAAPCPIAYAFRNTRDGYEVLYEDGIFCEFAVFEEPELERIPFAPGRIVWKRPEVPDAIRIPRAMGLPKPRPAEWSLGEALTNLYVGLCRLKRGEKLSAMRLIQVCAVDRVLELVERAEAEAVEPESGAPRDPFSAERRIESRRPRLAEALPRFAQGYDRSSDSAAAILEYIEAHFAVDPAMKRAIRAALGFRLSTRVNRPD